MFRTSKRDELSLNDQEIVILAKSERGMSIDETSQGDNKSPDQVMRLKKTTILSGNHMKGARDRAQSDAEIGKAMQFKGELKN